MSSTTQIPTYRCPDCGATIGMAHEHGCDIEPCPECGRQKISCDCWMQDTPALSPVVWSGFWPGELECLEYGLFSTFKAWEGFAACNADFPGARPDFNTLFKFGQWNKEKRRWMFPVEITGLCYCENDLCEKMWPASCGVDGPQDADGHTILPCGHRLERLVASAECFRSDNSDAEDYRWLRDHGRIDDYALDDLEEHKTDQGR